jgi:hypothetical protein
MPSFTANVTVDGDVDAGTYTMLVTQIELAEPPVEQPPVTPPNEDSWSQPEPPPEPSVRPGSSGRTLVVGTAVRAAGGIPGKPGAETTSYSTVQEALDAAQDGDTVQVTTTAPKPANGGVSVAKSVRLFADPGVRWDFQGERLAGGDKAAIVPTNGAAVIIEGFEISGCGMHKSGADLTSAIRNDGANWITIKNCNLHDNQNHIAAASANAMVEVIDCVLIRGGLGDGQSHNVYINQINQLTMTRVNSTEPNEGHALKCRAYRTIVNGGYYAAKGGRAIDCPNGGKLTVAGAALDKPADANNGTILGYASENQDSGVSTQNTLEGGTIIKGRSNCIIHTQAGVITFAPDINWQGDGNIHSEGSGTVVGLPA